MYIHLEFKSFPSKGLGGNYIIKMYMNQLEKIANSHDNVLIASYVEDLKANQRNFSLNQDDKVRDEFYAFVEFWDTVITGNETITFEHFNILPLNSRYATLTDKSNNPIIVNSSISIWGKYPYVYGTCQKREPNYDRYDFIIDLRDMQMVSEANIGSVEFAKIFETLKNDGYIVGDPVPFYMLKFSNYNKYSQLKRNLKPTR
jgi:hypothetical protein